MTHLYFLQNQHGEFLDKAGAWSPVTDSKSLYRTALKDEAINQSVEYSVKNPDLRINIIAASGDESGRVALPITAPAPGDLSAADC